MALQLPSSDDRSPSVSPVRPVKKLFDVPMARRTLPLVRRVAADLVARHAEFVRQTTLQRRLLDLPATDWETRKARQRQLMQTDSVSEAFAALKAELDRAGLVLLDAARGVIGYRSIVNGSLAYLVYQHDDQDVLFWRYHDQKKLRPIPTRWSGHSVAAVILEEQDGLLV